MKKRMKKVATLCLAGVTAMSTVGVTGSTVFADETNYDVDNMDFDNVELRVAFRYNNGSDTDGQSIWEPAPALYSSRSEAARHKDP